MTTVDRRVPRCVHVIWLGSDLPAALRSMIDRLGALAPDWEVRVWRDDDLDWLVNRRWFDASPTFAGRSNIARYEILERFGGLYVDADFEFLRSPGSLDLGPWGLAVAPEMPGHYCNGIMAASPGHPFLRWIVERVDPSIDAAPDAPTFVSSGPHLLTRELARWSAATGEGWTEIPRDLVFPYSYDRLDRASGPWSPQVVAVHHWNQARAGRAWVVPPSATRAVLGSVGDLARRVRVRLRPRARARAVVERVRRPSWRPNGFSLGDGRAFTVQRSGRPIIFDSDDVNQLWFLATEGRYDRRFRRFLAATLSGSDTYVDVGANIGQFVVEAMWRLDVYGRVFAFEPNPRTARILRENIELNRNAGAQAEVRVEPVAASDRPGTADLSFPRWHPARATLSPDCIGDVDAASVEEVSVPVVRLDDALGALSHIRVMKIDVEGHEPNVLAGAMSLVESGRVDYVDIEAVRRHLGPRAEVLGDLLARWEGEGVTFWDIGPRGRLVRHSRPIREVLAGADHGHLVIDARIFGDRARSGSGAA